MITLLQVEEQIQDLFEGNLSSEQWLQLQEILKHSPEALEIYCTYARMHSILGERAQETKALEEKTSIVPFESIISTQRKKTIKATLISAVALISISLITLWLIRTPQVEPTIAFKTSPNSCFTIIHDKTKNIQEGAMVLEEGSSLSLTQGSLELNFSSGVRAIIQSPAEITLLEKDTLFVREGVGWFHVPPEAVGFKVKTPELLVTDLGTEFGVISDSSMHDEVHLLKGSVIVETLSSLKQSETLNKRTARASTPTGKITSTTLTPERFITELPNRLHYMHWSFDEVSNQGFIAKGHHFYLDKGFAKPKSTPAKEMLTKGRFGNAVRFRGREADGLFTQWKGVAGDQARTVAFWIKKDSSDSVKTAESIINWGLNKPEYPGWNSKYRISVGARHISLGGFNGNKRLNTAIHDGKWHHLAFTYKKGEKEEPIVNIYLDGSLIESVWVVSRKAKRTTLPRTVISNDLSDPVIFGVDLYTPNLGHHFQLNGVLDEIYIFEGALDANAIQRLYQENKYSP